MKDLKRMIILDSNSILHRAFHALPLLTTKNGEPINAVYGFLLILFKAIRELNPDYIVACFDFPAKTFRHQKFKEYKAKRPPISKDLASQIPKVKEVLNSLSIPIFEKEGFEADDLIATIAKKAESRVSEIFVLTGDFDTLQIVNKKIRIFFLGKKMKEPLIYTEKKVIAEFGILPKQIPDFKALVGDQSDNIPGVLGIGQKTAVEILRNYGDLETLYSQIEKEKKINEKIKKELIINKEKVFLSKNLAKLEDEVEIDFDLKKCNFGSFNPKVLQKVLERFEFYSLLKRIPEITSEVKGMKKLF